MINQQVFESFPLLRTKRLLLRQVQMEDALEILNMRQNKQVNRFIARNPMTDETDARLLAEKTRVAFEARSGIAWAGILRDRPGIIGTCGFNKIDYLNNRAEIGGELAVDFWGKDLAFEAVTAICAFGFREMNLHTIEAIVSPENRGAVFLLEKLGFEKEAHFKERICFNGSYSDMAVYTLFRSQFEEKGNAVD